MKQFIEDAGIVYVEMGLPRMAGRIFGWLLLCEPAHQSAEQLANILEASKGSISSMTQLLIRIGLVERMGLPGKRGTYYRIKSGSWSELMRARMSHVTSIRRLAELGLSLTAERDEKSRQRLQHLRDFYAFLEEQIPALLDRYDLEHKRVYTGQKNK